MAFSADFVLILRSVLPTQGRILKIRVLASLGKDPKVEGSRSYHSSVTPLVTRVAPSTG